MSFDVALVAAGALAQGLVGFGLVVAVSFLPVFFIDASIIAT
jgi:hypothetical protein